jgi:hypothetical protein
MKDNYNGNFGEPDEVPYGQICSCNPSNGGSGICGCIMGNKMVPNPKKFGSSTNTNTFTTFYFKEDIEKRKAEEIVDKNKKINILTSLIEVVKNDHPEFDEENTTGWDLIENANIWLDELKNKK